MDEDDNSKDGLLNLIIANTEASLKVKLHKKLLKKFQMNSITFC